MLWLFCIVILVAQAGVKCINRPVYKIALTQDGYAQALQYDVEIPPLREFTFCIWLQFTNFGHDQHIFTYLINGDRRIIRLWLDKDGIALKLSILGKQGAVESITPAGFGKNSWRHVCLTYQSDFGAWALYIDGKIVSCEAATTLRGFVVPAGGIVIIGYGAVENGAPNGIEGEVYGANMILVSSIERNHTIKRNVYYAQKSFSKNKIKDKNENVQHTVLNNLKSDDTYNVYKQIAPTNTNKKNKSFIRFSTPNSFIHHSVGSIITTAKPADLSQSEEELLDVSVETVKPDKNSNISFWDLVNKSENLGNFRNHNRIKSTRKPSEKIHTEYTTAESKEPIPSIDKSSEIFNLELLKPPASESVYNLYDEITSKPKYKQHELSEIETPPPPTKSNKVYGQWSSSKFAGSVLNYLKSNVYLKEHKRTPITIPLNKYSDSFPYASDFKVTRIKPLILQRPNFADRRTDNRPQRNLQVIEYDIRSSILKAHAQTKPKKVEIINRGDTKNHPDHRFYRSANFYNFSPGDIYGSLEEKIDFPETLNSTYSLEQAPFDFHQSNSLLSILPFLKSVEYFQENSNRVRPQKEIKSNDMYSNSFATGNKWHNIKSYSNDFTPSDLNSKLTKSVLEAQKFDNPERHPSLRLKYMPGQTKVVLTQEDPSIVKGRKLATEISDESNNYGSNSVSILKYNHGSLPRHEEQNKKKSLEKGANLNKTLTYGTHFHKQVKLGNALNEKKLLGSSEEDRELSFVGGDENVPDINRYRSDLDQQNDNVPSSLGPRICGVGGDNDDTMLYVQVDGSIDVSNILTSVKNKNTGIQFIIQNYNKCSWENSDFDKNSLLLINWSETPVRLFGGAHPKKTIDLCGFF